MFFSQEEKIVFMKREFFKGIMKKLQKKSVFLFSH